MGLRDQGGRKWYVVQTYSSYENRVKADLEQRIATMGMGDSIFRVEVPVEERVIVKDGRSRKVSRKLYPGYVLVEMVMDEQSWHVVRHTPGVTGFVGAGTHAMPLSDDEVDRLMPVLDKAARGSDKTTVEIDLKPGDTVTVKRGPLEGQTGPVVEINPENGKVKFTVSLFGRDTVTEVDYQLLEKL